MKFNNINGKLNINIEKDKFFNEGNNMIEIAKLQKVIDDFWESYSNPFAFNKPIIKIVDIFDDVAKSFTIKDLHDIECYAVVRIEEHYFENDEEEQSLVSTEEICFRLRFDKAELLLKKLKKYFHEDIK